MLVPVASEAIAALNRSVSGWLEWNLTGLTTVCADCVEHLARCSVAGTAAGVALTSSTAGFASLRFIRKTFLGEKLLFVDSEDEFCSAIFAGDGLVVVRQIPRSKYCAVQNCTTQL